MSSELAALSIQYQSYRNHHLSTCSSSSSYLLLVYIRSQLWILGRRIRCQYNENSGSHISFNIFIYYIDCAEGHQFLLVPPMHARMDSILEVRHSEHDDAVGVVGFGDNYFYVRFITQSGSDSKRNEHLSESQFHLLHVPLRTERVCIDYCRKRVRFGRRNNCKVFHSTRSCNDIGRFDDHCRSLAHLSKYIRKDIHIRWLRFRHGIYFDSYLGSVCSSRRCTSILVGHTKRYG